MHKEKLSGLAQNELVKMIPERYIKKSGMHYANVGGYKGEQVPMQLSAFAKEKTETYFQMEGELPGFRYVLHDKMDGEITSAMLCETLKETEVGKDVVYNPFVNENALEYHIKPSVLKAKAIEAGLAEDIKLSFLQLWGLLLSGIGSAFAVIKELAELFVGGKKLLDIFTLFDFAGYFLYLAFPALFLGIATWVFFTCRKNNKIFFNNLRNAVKELDAQEYEEFLELFEPEMFKIPDCETGSKVFVCALESYNLRQKQILSICHKASSGDQLWWVFLRKKGSEVEEDFMLKVRDKNKVRIDYYELMPLSAKDKKKLATATYRNQARFRPENDAGIKLFGVDYIFRFVVKNKAVADERSVREKIKNFCAEHSTAYGIDIGMVVRLVADLACNYKIDFYDKKWQRLFDGTRSEYLNELDDAISAELGIANKTLKVLIPEIVSNFEDCFEETLAVTTPNATIDLYDQWCIVKCLKACDEPDEYRHIALADALMNEFENSIADPDNERDFFWLSILVRSMETFWRNQQFWVLPMLVHHLLETYENATGFTGEVFSQKTVLDVARANLLLNFNTSAEKDAYFEIDHIEEHYRVVVKAVQERKGEAVLEQSTSVPLCFDILKLNKQQRRRYYNALLFLNEKDVLSYYEYMFDLFCAEVCMLSGDMRFCIKRSYQDELYKKYGEHQNDESSVAILHIKTILKNMLGLLRKQYANKSFVCEGIENLYMLLSGDNSEEELRAGLFTIAKLDIVGADTLSFIACLITRIRSDNVLTADVYLNFGNYLISLMFLTYHENSSRNFFNNDFWHLVTLCTAYEDPGDIMVGYLSYCDAQTKPEASQKRIAEYISQYRDVHIRNLYEVINSIGIKEVEAFFSYVICTGKYLLSEEKVPVFERLRSRVREKFSDYEHFLLLDELLTLYIDNCSTSTFEQAAPEENAERILCGSNNTVFLIFSKYFELYLERYIGVLPRLAKKILNSSLTQRWLPVMWYVLHSEDFESEAYIETCKLLYSVFESCMDDVNEVWCFEKMERILSKMIQRKEERPDLYEWLEEGKATDFWRKSITRKGVVILVLAKEYIAQRMVINYGIVLYMMGLMTSLNVVVPEEYNSLGESEKIDYIIENFKQLQAIGEHKCANGIYIDMLTAFIRNNEDIQHRLALSEKECLLKIANDTKKVMEVIRVSEVVRKEVCSMIDAYIVFLNK